MPTIARQILWAEIQERPLRLKLGEQRISATTCPKLRQIYADLGPAMRSTLQELGKADLPPAEGTVRVDEDGVVWTLEGGAWFSEPAPLCEPAWHYDIQWRERPELVVGGNDLFSEHAGWIKHLIELFDTCDHDYDLVRRP